eukprot:CAMPEP_0116876970 /NCGR_PEP_ID=MMETSP0463-20121206/8812_1 /TAXON_ID=181622 /ORGANISM="Strombidinopsis sp, Strain SopsisLIS2011" /LENGTH=37 /DNA_ID= /DNA_START= /DNA_END= /DNA_ORIENTATION=
MNNDKEEVEFDIKIESGVEALDYTSIVTKKHLRPIEL